MSDEMTITLMVIAGIAALVLIDVGRFSAQKTNNQNAFKLASEKEMSVDYSASFMAGQVFIDRTNQKILFYFNEKSWVIIPTKDIPRIRSYSKKVSDNPEFI